MSFILVLTATPKGSGKHYGNKVTLPRPFQTMVSTSLIVL